MKFINSKYEIGDVVVVKPPNDYLEAHSVFTIKNIMVEADKDGSTIRYSFKETRWMSFENDIIRKINL